MTTTSSQRKSVATYCTAHACTVEVGLSPFDAAFGDPYVHGRPGTEPVMLLGPLRLRLQMLHQRARELDLAVSLDGREPRLGHLAAEGEADGEPVSLASGDSGVGGELLRTQPVPQVRLPRDVESQARVRIRA